MKTAVISIACFAGLSTASPVLDTNQNRQAIEVLGNSPAFTTVTIDLAGTESWDTQGDPDNATLLVQLITDYVWLISYDITIATNGASWLSEPTIALGDSDYTPDLYLTPGIGTDMPGTASFSSGGMIDLSLLGLDFYLNPDRLLSLEIFESFDDVADSPDAIFLAGSNIKIYQIPTPGSLAFLCLGGLIAGRRCR